MIDRMALWLELVGGLRRLRSTLSLQEWWSVLAVLDVVDARVVVLHVLHDLKLAEIGERLDVSPQAVHKRWRNARRQLKQLNKTLELLTS